MGNFEIRRVLPDVPETLSAEAEAAISIYGICQKLALEERTSVGHPNGRLENVSEHSLSLSIVAPVISSILYPELNADHICRLCSIHDSVEAYVGDTPTHEYAKVDFEAKQSREAAGLKMLLEDYKKFPAFVELINEYEDQVTPESRFVKVADKLMPLIVHLFDNGGFLKQFCSSKEELLKDAESRERNLLKDYPEFKELINLRVELSRTVADRYLT